MARLVPVIAVFVALVVVGTASGQTTAGAAPAVRSALKGASAARILRRVPSLEDQLVAAINDLRRQNALVPLRFNRELAAAARAHTLSMAEDGYFEHESSTGEPFWYRLKTKYPIAGRRVWSVGENLAWASPSLTAQQTLDLWLKSAGHRQNLLKASWRDIGIGCVFVQPATGVFVGDAATIVTADFGVRR
jgi:uncharacterized protein YkwD